MTAVIVKFISFLLCTLLAVPAAEPARAEYLGFKPLFKVSDTTPLDSLMQIAGQKGFVFEETPEYADLVSCGTFLQTSSAQELREYLTSVNGFEECSLNKGSYPEPGDIVFKLSASGGALSYELWHGGALPDKGNYSFVRVVYPSYADLVWLYLSEKAELSPQVCCGIMANMYCESLFQPLAEEENGQHGYGICQWTGYRKADFEKWCRANKLKTGSLYTQLCFLQYELDNKPEFKKLVRMLNSCSEDGDGAYDAAHVFCLFFEDPINAELAAEERGALAQDSYYEAYRKCK